MADLGALVARAGALRKEVAEHKKAMHDHRTRLRAVATELTELEAQIIRLKFGLTPPGDPQPVGVGAIHGRTRTPA